MKEEKVPRATEGPDRSVGCEPLGLRKIASKQLKTLEPTLSPKVKEHCFQVIQHMPQDFKSADNQHIACSVQVFPAKKLILSS